MNFPTLTSGAVGALKFNHLNDIFRRIEKLEQEVQVGSTKASDKIGIVFYARITAQQGNRNAFVQVAPRDLQNLGYLMVEGGITSTIAGDEFADPIYSANLKLFEVYSVTRRRMLDGMPYFDIVGQANVTKPFIIQSATPESGGNPIRWAYRGTEAYRPEATWIPVPGAEQKDLFNGCEANADALPNIGVGTVLPSGVQATRNPINNGTVVMATEFGNSNKYAFSVPNGYTLQC